jgi:hypothetical protein
MRWPPWNAGVWPEMALFLVSSTLAGNDSLRAGSAAPGAHGAVAAWPRVPQTITHCSGGERSRGPAAQASPDRCCHTLGRVSNKGAPRAWAIELLRSGPRDATGLLAVSAAVHAENGKPVARSSKSCASRAIGSRRTLGVMRVKPKWRHPETVRPTHR